MAKEFMCALNIFLTALDDQDEAPIRWNWQHHLLLGCEILFSTPDIQRKTLAEIACLVLSSSTYDISCINATIELHKKGLLSLDALMKATEAEIAAVIKPCGIQDKRAGFLKKMAKMVKESEKWKGEFPCDVDELQKIEGVGPKAAKVLATECFGFPVGVPSDVHVVEAVIGYGFVDFGKLEKNLTPSQAEELLLTWMQPRKLNLANRTFGSMAQLFTQDLKTVVTEKQKILAGSVVEALDDYLHKPLHLQMVWCGIAMLKQHYRELAAANSVAADKKNRRVLFNALSN
jgi:endonuclease III